MLINRKRNFNELDWWNPTTWFGQPSIPPPDFDATAQWQSPLPSSKSTDNGIMSMNSFEAALKSNFVSPFTSAEKSVVSAEKTVVSDVKTETKKIEDGIINVAKAIETDIVSFKDGVITGFDKVGNTFETFGKNVENFVINDIEPIGKDLYKVISSMLKGTVYLIERPMQVAAFGGGYLLLRYFNEYKQAIS